MPSSVKDVLFITVGAVVVAVLTILALIWAGVPPEAAAPIAAGVVAAVAAGLSLRKDVGVRRADYGQRPLLHHVSLPVTNLERSVEFYLNGLGLRQIPRAKLSFGVEGAWFELPTGQQLHLLVSPSSTFRSDENARREVWNDCHFALRVTNLSEMFDRLDQRKAFLTDHPYVNNKHYPHFYTLDPDNHVIEVNTEPPAKIND